MEKERGILIGKVVLVRRSVCEGVCVMCVCVSVQTLYLLQFIKGKILSVCCRTEFTQLKSAQVQVDLLVLKECNPPKKIK